MPLVVFRIVDAIGRCPALRVAGKVVVVDLLRFLTPRCASVFELADEFLFLRIDADAWVTAATEVRALRADVLELPIALGVLLARVQHLAVAAQAELFVAQQPTDRRRTGTAIQPLRQRPQP